MPHSMQLPEFSARELELIQDNELFPLKFSTVQKISELFLLLEMSLKDKAISSHFPFPDHCELKGGKISKGENLDGFPWLVLDYPRYFDQNDFLIFRTQCWFGHGFSFSLLLKGKPIELLKTTVPYGFQFAINENIWGSDPQSEIWQSGPTIPVGAEAVRCLKDLKTANPIQAMHEALKAFNEIIIEFGKPME